MPIVCLALSRLAITSNRLYGQNLLAVARRTFPSLQYVSAGDVVIVAPIPGSPNTEPLELSPEIWTTVRPVVPTVTICLRSGMS
jgi:hypothetical protein